MLDHVVCDNKASVAQHGRHLDSLVDSFFTVLRVQLCQSKIVLEDRHQLPVVGKKLFKMSYGHFCSIEGHLVRCVRAVLVPLLMRCVSFLVVRLLENH